MWCKADQSSPEMKKHSANIENMAKKCFIDNEILWKRIDRHGGQHTVIVLPNSLTQNSSRRFMAMSCMGMKDNTRPKRESFNHIGGQAWIKKSMTI